MKTSKFRSFFVVILFLLSISFSDCSKKDAQEPQKPDSTIGLYTISEVKNNTFQEQINAWQIDNFGSITNFQSNKGPDIKFDISNLYMVKKTGIPGQILVERQVGYNVCNSINYRMAFYENADNYITYGIIVKTEDLSSEVTHVEYFDLKSTLLLSLDFNLKDQSTKIIYIFSPSKSCGQAVMNCISDYYTQHGWGSVGLTILSIFYPEIPILAAADCAYQNCR